MSPADIVAAAISVGVRVERIVELSGGPELAAALRASGGKTNADGILFTGLDRDNVEWRISILPGHGGVSVVAPSRPGSQPTEQAQFRRVEDAYEYASIFGWGRKDLSHQDIRLEVAGKRIAYAGPAR